MRLAAMFLLAVVALAGCQKPPAGQPGPAPPSPSPTPPAGPEPVPDERETEPTVVAVYFPTMPFRYLEAEARDVVAVPGNPASLAEAALEAWADGPAEEGHAKGAPLGTKVLKVSVAERIATVDLNKAFVEKFQGGSNVAHLVVFSLVNTLCSIDGIDKVQILVEGEKVTDFAGVEDLSKPLEFDDASVGGEKL